MCTPLSRNNSKVILLYAEVHWALLEHEEWASNVLRLWKKILFKQLLIAYKFQTIVYKYYINFSCASEYGQYHNGTTPTSLLLENIPLSLCRSCQLYYQSSGPSRLNFFPILNIAGCQSSFQGTTSCANFNCFLRFSINFGASFLQQ